LAMTKARSFFSRLMPMPARTSPGIHVYSLPVSTSRAETAALFRRSETFSIRHDVRKVPTGFLVLRLAGARRGRMTDHTGPGRSTPPLRSLPQIERPFTRRRPDEPRLSLWGDTQLNC